MPIFRQFSQILSTTAILLFSLAALATPRPNIILVMADDMGWGDPSYNSSTVTYADGTPHPDQGWISTPVMDTMASTGLRFDRFYAASAVCSPTRASCLTGRNPVRVGIGGANSGKLGFDETPLSEVLSDIGYATGHFGKWHLGTMTTLRNDANRGAPGNTSVYSAPWHHQYDVCFATESKVPTYNPYSGGSPLIADFSDPNFYGTYYWSMPETWNESSGEGAIVPIEVVNNTEDGDDSKLLVDQAIPFMQDAVASNQPFLLVLWFHTPHKPIIDPDGVSKVNSSDAAKDAIEDMDLAIGRIRDELDNLGVRGNTMFWVTSDNGPENGVDSFNENDLSRPIRSGRFRDRKGKLFDGGIIVPSILEWPDVINSPASTDMPAVTSDYYPTILDYLELTVPGQKPIDGISLRPVIEGTATTRTKPIGFKLGNDVAWRNHRYKLVDQDTGWLLFDMVNIAPGEESEQTPLATEANVNSQPQEIQDIYNTMLSEFNTWMSSANSDTPYIHASQPTVSLSTPLTSVSGSFTVTATFSEAVTQLNASEFVVTNGNPSNLSGSGTTWTVTITPSAPGAVTINLPEGSVIDADGNINGASNQLTVTNVNTSAPTVGLTTPSASVSGSFVVTSTFSEDVSGLTASDFDVTNGIASGLNGGPATYTVDITPVSAGTVSVFLPSGSAEDGESNSSNASNTLQVVYSAPAAPSVTLSGPSVVSAPYSVSVSFSEPVTGLSESDFLITNGTAGSLSGAGANYAIVITATAAGDVTVSLPAGSVTDQNDGLDNTASNDLVTTYSSLGGSGGAIVVVTDVPSANQTVDSNGNVPGDGSNNVDKFTAGTINSNVVNPYSTSIYVRGSPNNADRNVRAVVKFDVSILTGQPIASAKLNFNGHSLNTSNATNIQAVALAADWNASGAPQPTFDHASTGTPADGGSIVTGLDALHAKDYSFDITEFVRNWADGTWSNYGLGIRLTNASVNNGLGIKPSGPGGIELVVEVAPLTVTDFFNGPGAGELTLEWNSAPGLEYTIKTSESLDGTWEDLATITGAAGETTAYTHVDGLAGIVRRFYRIIFPATPAPLGEN